MKEGKISYWMSIFLQIGREKGEFQILLDALDKIKTKVREIHLRMVNLSQNTSIVFEFLWKPATVWWMPYACIQK